MSRSVFSPSWHLMAELKPRLLPHSRLYRHVYRGQRWYIVRDTAKGRHHRLSPAAYAFVQRMDGARTVQQLWDEICANDEHDVPTQQEVVELLAQLHAQDLLQCDITPDAAELLDRYRKHKRSKWLQRVTNPMSIRIPLVDPDRLLSRWVERCRWAFSVPGGLLWLAIVLPAALLAIRHWRELTDNVSDQLLSSANLTLMAALFIPIKILHELGHGLATKVWGGSVREMGVMFLVFAPVPYVDSSAATTFESKYRRAVVGAAGMLVELVIAALALYVWLLVEPGMVRAVAFNVMVVSSISTVIVNGNPLLRFDGYYILADLIEIPNLAQRGQKYWTYLSDRYLFRARDLDPPGESTAEKCWIVPYTVISWLYRIAITIGIILFVAPQFFVFGALLAAWGAGTLILVPIWKALKHVFTGASLGARRSLAISTTAVLTLAVLGFLWLVPMPLRTQAEGAYWLPDNAIVRSGEEGFFVRWLLPSGSPVTAGTPVLVMRNARLEAAVVRAQARLAEARARFDTEAFNNPSQAEILRESVLQTERELAHASFRNARLVVEAHSDGVLMIPQPQDMQQRYYRKGDLLGYVLDPAKTIIRVAVGQDDVYLVRNRLRAIEVRPVDEVSAIWPSTLLREVPGGIDELPIPTLATLGGGTIAVEPGADERLQLLNRHFLFDLVVPPQIRRPHVGARVYVRFTHEHEPLLDQWQRRIRQLFLSRLNV
jgi:putative peptide zinc metalloprotease protein